MAELQEGRVRRSAGREIGLLPEQAAAHRDEHVGLAGGAERRELRRERRADVAAEEGGREQRAELDDDHVAPAWSVVKRGAKTSALDAL